MAARNLAASRIASAATRHEGGCWKLPSVQVELAVHFSPREVELAVHFSPREVELAVHFWELPIASNGTQVPKYKGDMSYCLVAAGLRQISVSKEIWKQRGGSAFFSHREGRENNLALAETPLRPGKPETRLPSSRLNQQLCRRGTGWV